MKLINSGGFTITSDKLLDNDELYLVSGPSMIAERSVTYNGPTLIAPRNDLIFNSFNGIYIYDTWVDGEEEKTWKVQDSFSVQWDKNKNENKIIIFNLNVRTNDSFNGYFTFLARPKLSNYVNKK